MDNKELKETVLTNLRSVTQSCKGGVPLDRLENDYRVLLGTGIPYRDLGHKSLESFLKSNPDVISLKTGQNGRLVAEGVADSSTAHIASLVSRQKQTKTVGRGSRRPYRGRRTSFSSRYSTRGGSRSSYSSSSNFSIQSSTRSSKYSTKTPSPVYLSRTSPPPPKVSSSKPSYSAQPKTKSSTSSYRSSYELPPRFQKSQARAEIASNEISTAMESLSVNSNAHISPPRDYTSTTMSSPYSLQRTITLSPPEPPPEQSRNVAQRKLRPLLPKNNEERTVRFQNLDLAETAKEFIERYSEMNDMSPNYSTRRIGQKRKDYICNLKLGSKTYQSYPVLGRTEEEAEEIAATNARKYIQENKVLLDTLPETPITNAEEIQILLGRIEEIIIEKPSGMFTNGIVEEYEHAFHKSLPSGWLDLLRNSSMFDIEAIDVPYGRVPEGVSCIVRPAKGLSSGSTTPSETSSRAYPELQELESEDTSKDSDSLLLQDMKPLEIPHGNEWGVYITNISTYVTARFVDYDAGFLDMSQKMSSYYEQQILPVKDVQEKQLYTTIGDRVNEELIMHRVLANRILDNNLVECYYVDEGIFANVEKTNLQELNEEFFKLPYQAVQLILDSLDEFEPFMKLEHLEKNLLNKTLIAQVKRWYPAAVEDMPDAPGILKNIYSVILFDTSDSENDVCLNDEIKLSVLESMKCRLPKPGVFAQGYLTHVTEVGQIYLRFIHPDKSWLEVELEKLSSVFEEKCHETVITPAKMYAAKYENGKWYRAIISQSSSFKDKKLIEVKFVDYGHLSIVRKSELCELLPYSEFLATVDYQAIKCELNNAMPSSNYQWTEAASNKLTELAPYGQDLIIIVINPGDNDTLPKVKLCKRLYVENDSFFASINDSLALGSDLFVPKNIPVSSNKIKVPSHLSLQPNTVGSSTSNSTNFTPQRSIDENAQAIFTPTTPTNDGSTIQWIATPDIKSPEAFEDDSPAPLNLPEVPAENQYFDVFVTIAANPHNFIVQPLKKADELEKLRCQMQQFYSVEENLIEIPPSLLKKNCFYATLHSDDMWYRARLESVVGSDPVMATVHYVDYGDYSTVPVQNLQKLWSQFRSLPCQAIKASLAGVKPIEGDWMPEHCVEFREMVTNKAFVSYVQHKRQIKKEDASSLELVLLLIDTTHPEEDIFISDLLISKAMALKSS